jgi:hypothetical protein
MKASVAYEDGLWHDEPCMLNGRIDGSQRREVIDERCREASLPEGESPFE